MNNTKINHLLFIFFFVFIINNLIAKEILGNPENGIKIFKKECTACHSIDLTKKLIGPPLQNITKKRNIEWLHKWIKNNKSLIKNGDKEALDIYNKYNKSDMNLFLHLSKDDINDILSFIDNPEIINNKKNDKNIINNSIIDKYSNELNNTYEIIFVGFIILFILLLIILIRLIQLIKILNSKKLGDYEIINYNIFNIINIIKIIKKYYYIGYSLIFIFSIISIYSIWNFLMLIDVNKGYKPIQPIYFSHKIHSGINKINCQYCHSDSQYSKFASIPSTNVCMNCHITIDKYQGKYIEKGKNRSFYNKEINKLYKSIGWDPIDRKYKNASNPIEWIKIHNMPDFVYFNHSQHIVVGEKAIKKIKNVDISCNACHGNVQNMDSVEMANDFTMEWCINCHRNISIDKNNNYYIEYFKNIHKKHYKKNKITVSDVGGTECVKCHY